MASVVILMDVVVSMSAAGDCAPVGGRMEERVSVSVVSPQQRATV